MSDQIPADFLPALRLRGSDVDRVLLVCHTLPSLREILLEGGPYDPATVVDRVSLLERLTSIADDGLCGSGASHAAAFALSVYGSRGFNVDRALAAWDRTHWVAFAAVVTTLVVRRFG